MLLALALLAAAADLQPRVVVPARGPVRTCWTPPGPDEAAWVQVDAERWHPSVRCVAGEAEAVGLVDGEALPPEPARATWLGPAPEPALLPDGVQHVTTGPDGALWLARCRQGLTRLDPRTGARHTWTADTGLPEGCVTDVDVDVHGRAWALTPGHVVLVDPSTGLTDIQPFTADGASVAAVHLGADGRAWLAGQGGRLRAWPVPALGERLQPVALQAWTGVALGALGTLHAVRQGPDGRLWLSSRDRLTRLDPATGRFDLLVTGEDLPPGRPGPVAFAPDGAWVVIRPDRPGEGSAAVVGLGGEGVRLSRPAGLPDAPLGLTATDDGALWIADARGLVRVAPDRAEARRIAVAQGYVPGGPWTSPAEGPGAVWAAFEGGPDGAVLTRLEPDGTVTDRLAPTPVPAPGRLVRTDGGVLLANADGFWTLDVAGATWSAHPGFGGGLRGWVTARLQVVHTDPAGRTWLGGGDGLRVGRVEAGFEDVPLPDDPEVLDVRAGPGGTTWIATGDALFARDTLGRLLRVVDDGGRPVTGVDRIDALDDDTVWAWGPGGGWTLSGSDAVRRLGGPVLDLVPAGDAAWVVHRGGVWRIRGETREAVDLDGLRARPEQIAVRDDRLVQVRGRTGLWRRDGEAWRRVIGVEGPFLRSGDGTLWRWDPDGLHVLPPQAGAWRWVGLGESGPTEAPSAPVDADAIAVAALDGVLAVDVQGWIVGDPRRRDPILDLAVRGTRWAALSRRGVLLRGDGYRLLETAFVPGPARRVALGDQRVCVAGSTTWCRQEGRWSTLWDVFDLVAPLPAVDLHVDAADRVWMLQPGALCREGEGCRRLDGPGQTVLHGTGDGRAFVGGTRGLVRLPARGSDEAAATLREGTVRDLDLVPYGGGVVSATVEGGYGWRLLLTTGDVLGSDWGVAPRPHDALDATLVDQVVQTTRGLLLVEGLDRFVVWGTDPETQAVQQPRLDRWLGAEPTRAGPRRSRRSRP